MDRSATISEDGIYRYSLQKEEKMSKCTCGHSIYVHARESDDCYGDEKCLCEAFLHAPVEIQELTELEHGCPGGEYTAPVDTPTPEPAGKVEPITEKTVICGWAHQGSDDKLVEDLLDPLRSILLNHAATQERMAKLEADRKRFIRFITGWLDGEQDSNDVYEFLKSIGEV